jgi:hypothetical protein
MDNDKVRREMLAPLPAGGGPLPTLRRYPRFVFFLGGHDLEMVTIRDLLKSQKIRPHDSNLTWGVTASAYRREIEQTLNQGLTPVLIELAMDFEGRPGGAAWGFA